LMNTTKRSVVEDKWRRTPLHRAAEAGNLEVRRMTCRGQQTRPADTHWPGISPQVVRVLLAHGIDVNARNEWGWTALHKVRHNKNCHDTHMACTY